jgi:hypothetical protein
MVVCLKKLLQLAALVAFAALSRFSSVSRAQENYEIQVYPYDTVEPGHTMVELHMASQPISLMLLSAPMRVLSCEAASAHTSSTALPNSASNS